MIAKTEALTNLILASQSLHASCQSGYSFGNFIEGLNRQATALNQFDLPGDHVRNLADELLNISRSERPLGSVGAAALLRKLEAWHLLPPAEMDTEATLRKYREEIDCEKDIDWESEVDWDRLHPIRSGWAACFEGENESDIDKAYAHTIFRIDFDFISRPNEIASSRRDWILGTPGYCPPEAWKRTPRNFQFDVFGLSATLYFMLTGKEPFAELAAMHMLQLAEDSEIEAELSKPALPPRQLNPKITVRLNRVLLKGLSLNPEERHADAVHFQREFLQAIGKPIPID